MSTVYTIPRERLVKRLLLAIERKRHQLTTIVGRHQKMIEERRGHLQMQIACLVLVFAAWNGIWLMNAFFSDFFAYPYFKLSLEWEVLIGFWPLYLWCGVLIAFETFFGEKVYSSHLDEQLLGWGLLTGNMDALWEELGFRGAFICYGMLVVMMFNWLLGTALVWFLVCLFIIATIGVVISDDTPTPIALIPAALAIGCFWTAGTTDPWYWVYNTITMPLLNLVSLGSFTDILNPELHSPLFVMGGIVANVWFRDGHKYQGIVGYLDSWLIGFVLLYAMMTYGLLTAITLHAIWNTTIYLIRYGRRKFFR